LGEVWGELGRLGRIVQVGGWGRIGELNLKRPKPSPHKGYTKIISKIKTTKFHRSINR